jgi:hypothetical protein
MVHFDQPAVLGCLMVLNGIIDFEKYRKKRMLLISSLVGPILGRGYAVIFFLASWVIVKGIYELFFLKKKTITGLKIPILITLVSVPLPATMLSLNIWGEAKIRNLDWDQTSIVVSARKRLGIDSYTEVGKEKKKVKTVSFVLNQIYRAFDMVTPYAISGVHFKGYTNKLRHYLTVIPKVIFQIWILFFLFKILPHFWKLTTSFEKYLFNILIWGGILWLVLMKNLSHSNPESLKESHKLPLKSSITPGRTNKKRGFKQRFGSRFNSVLILVFNSAKEDL